MNKYEYINCSLCKKWGHEGIGNNGICYECKLRRALMTPVIPDTLVSRLDGRLDKEIRVTNNEVEIESSEETVALKHDGSKVRFELMSVPAMQAIAEVMTFGARKYTDHNWRKGFAWSRLIGAAIRHLFAWIGGEDKDPESKLSHLAHVGCCIMFLLEHEIRKLGTDDRYKTEVTEDRFQNNGK